MPAAPELVEACDWLSDAGYPTTGWKPLMDQDWYCSSRDQTFTDGHSVGYYGSGDANGPNEVHIRWHEVVASRDTAAREAFLRAADALNRKANGAPLPSVARNVILARGTGSWEQNGRTIWVQTDAPVAGATLPAVTGTTGVLGKWKYLRSHDVMLGLGNGVEGQVWIYKPSGWQAP